jgi:hypothetical protein
MAPDTDPIESYLEIEDKSSPDGVIGSSGQPTPAERHRALADGYANVLAMDRRRVGLDRRIAELAAHADEPDIASELRRLWLERRTLQERIDALRRALDDLQ